jgi:hypothetical protein
MPAEKWESLPNPYFTDSSLILPVAILILKTATVVDCLAVAGILYSFSTISTVRPQQFSREMLTESGKQPPQYFTG